MLRHETHKRDKALRQIFNAIPFQSHPDKKIGFITLVDVTRTLDVFIKSSIFL